MATAFFGGNFFSGEFFSSTGVTVEEIIKTGTGGIDPGEGQKRRRIVKPTGILHLPKKEGRKDVADRIDESKGIQAEIAGRLAREFAEESAWLESRPPVVEMSLLEVEAEIAQLLQKKIRTEQEEMMLMMLMVAIVV